MTSSPSKIQAQLPLRLIGTVVRGYGRGSRELGIPTANLDDATLKGSCTFDDLPTGIYWGFARVGNSGVCTTACSIGYNPTYPDNSKKTVEPHLIANDDAHRHISSCGESVLGDFYGQTLRLTLVGYLRPELPFEGIDKLIQAIKQDIVQSEEKGAGTDAITMTEKEWVTSEKDISD